MKQADPGSVPVKNWIEAEDEEAALERLDVYANMYFFRLLDSLKEDFEYTYAHIGDGAFHNLITDYLLEHPSSNPSLRFLGLRMESFVRKQGDKYPPWLADLIALEWARVDVFDAKEHSVVTSDDVQDLPPESWGELGFQLIPALRFLKLDYPVDRVWSLLDQEQKVSDVIEGDVIVIAWRQGFYLKHARISEQEYQALMSLQDGHSFGTSCEAFLPEIAEEQEWTPEQIQEAIQAAYQALVSWVRSGLLQSYT